MSDVVSVWHIEVKTKFDRDWRPLGAGLDQRPKTFPDQRRTLGE
jgi:hypothetical protein